MWNQIVGGAIGSIGSTIGYTANTAALVEGLVLINEYGFIPAMEKIDILANRTIYGEEQGLKTEYEWAIIKESYLSPVLGFISVGNNALAKGAITNISSQEDSISSIPIIKGSDNRKDLIYSKEGIARDPTAIGSGGSLSKLESDEIPSSSLSQIAQSMDTDKGQGKEGKGISPSLPNPYYELAAPKKRSKEAEKVLSLLQ